MNYINTEKYGIIKIKKNKRLTHETVDTVTYCGNTYAVINGNDEYYAVRVA